jgi:hypothetical protein
MRSLKESGVADATSWSHAPLGSTRSVVRQAGAIVLQVDSAVARVHGLAWLTNQRESAVLRRLADLQAEATAESWTAEQLASARLGVIRPRRSEVNALGQEYLRSLAPGVADAAHRIRRSGISVGLASDVAVEALFGVATALGVTPEDIHAPTVRFDALGFYTGSDVARRRSARTADGVGCVFIGARPPEFGMQREDAFIRFTGFVQQEGIPHTEALDTIGSYAELAALVAE